MITNLLDTSRLNWEVPEYVLLSLALGLVVGLIFGWMFGASGSSPSTGYTAIADGEAHVTARYTANNETLLEVFRPGTTGYTICMKEETITNSSMDQIEAWACFNHPDRTHPLMRDSN
jgi:hypothetical protein